MDEEIRQKLTERGLLFEKYGTGHHYLTYEGVIIYRSWIALRYKADGRCMVDIKTFSHQNPNSDLAKIDKCLGDDSLDTIPRNDLWMTWPFVAGFSFVAKQWGELSVNSLKPVIFDDTAYEYLVLPEKKKTLIKALVEYQSTAFNDIISGKGGGCIFLLHGSPGVGKTLTAESIAELLHRPLYSVGVGELGITTESLETKLKDILQVASTWNAVVLIDEADIFLQKRTEQDVQRNALVGIFLRLLEYHQGVLFLTTNRVSSFDPAFHSRITVALKYKDLQQPDRRKVWENLLQAAKIRDINLDTVSEYTLNGRQIKNSIRLAQALATSRKIPLNINHILETIKIAQQFMEDICLETKL